MSQAARRRGPDQASPAVAAGRRGRLGHGAPWSAMAVALAAAASTILGSGARAAWAAPGAVVAALAERAQRDGAVRVVVRLAETPQGEGSAATDEAGGTSAGPRRTALARTRARLLGALSGDRHRVIRELETVPFVALEVGPEALAALEASPDVERVDEDRQMYPQLPQSAVLSQAMPLWPLGIDGRGQTVAVIDTGVDTSHAMLSGATVAEACFSSGGSCPNGQTRQTGSGAAAPCTYEPDACGHGTHVAGIVLGRNGAAPVPLAGVAPGASLIAVQAASMASGFACGGTPVCPTFYDSDLSAALEWVYQQRESFQIASVNMSIGGGVYRTQAECDRGAPMHKALFDLLRSVGIAPVVAAGNDYDKGALSTPGCISSAVSVGAVSKLDQVTSFSNSAPFLSLLAPGDGFEPFAGIVSGIPGGGFDGKAGTSQATPHVAGAWALLRQVRPGASVDSVLSALRRGGVPVTDPGNGLTLPRLRVPDAVASLAGAQSCSPSDATACLLGGRFEVAVAAVRAADASGGAARALGGDDRAGVRFRVPGAPGGEVVVRMVDSCGDPRLRRYGVVASASAGMEVRITVTDTESGVARSYFRSAEGARAGQGAAAASAVDDPQAFDACR